ncbi:hypothetical protein Misp01_19790 [Microtetraspora sp. NBRC 13810]|nr:hypothetical protein Misp01_19790 [Microtetraspora sp. NBRC 13810]
MRISGGADTLRQYLAAGLVDELHIHVSPVLLGDGTRLFGRTGLGHVWLGHVWLGPAEVVASPEVTHLRYHLR